MTLKTRWEHFRATALRADAPAAMVELIRQAYYGGAIGYHQCLADLEETGSFDQFEEQTEALEQELLGTIEAILAEGAQP